MRLPSPATHFTWIITVPQLSPVTWLQRRCQSHVGQGLPSVGHSVAPFESNPQVTPLPESHLIYALNLISFKFTSSEPCPRPQGSFRNKMDVPTSKTPLQILPDDSVPRTGVPESAQVNALLNAKVNYSERPSSPKQIDCQVGLGRLLLNEYIGENPSISSLPETR